MVIALVLGSLLLLTAANIGTATLGIFAGLRLLAFRPPGAAVWRTGLLAGCGNTVVHLLYRLLLNVPLGTHALLMALVETAVVRWQLRLRWASAAVVSLISMILLTLGALLSTGAMSLLNVNLAQTERNPALFLLGMALEFSPPVAAALFLRQRNAVLVEADESRGERDRGMWLMAAVLGQTFIILWLAVSTLAMSTGFTTVSIPTLLALSLAFIPVVVYLVAELDHLMRQERLALQAELELARAQQEAASARASREAIARMAAGVAHDVRGPLTPVKNYLKMIRQILAHSPEAAKIQPLIDESQEFISDIEETLEDFLYLSRSPSTPEEIVDLHALVERLIREMAPIARSAGIEMAAVLDAPRAILLGRTNRLYRVFLNLVQNAIEACPGGGRVTIRTRPSAPGRVAIEVSDTGVGIPPENLREVFQPFFTTKRKGTGLGLTIVRHIVEEHGGTVALESRPGAGTTVTVTLPALDDKAERASAGPESRKQRLVEGAELAEPGLEGRGQPGELDTGA